MSDSRADRPRPRRPADPQILFSLPAHWPGVLISQRGKRARRSGSAPTFRRRRATSPGRARPWPPGHRVTLF